MINKIRNFKFVTHNSQKGMTILELLTVLMIFAVLSSVAIFNYGTFQANVDLTNLANNIALQVVGAQKAALAGLLPTQIPTVSPWKPSYGTYFSVTSAQDASGADKKDFMYFVDLNNNNKYDSSVNCTGDCLSKYTITRNDYISDISAFYLGDLNPHTLGISGNFTVTFSRPNSGANFSLNNGTFSVVNIAYVQITITNGKSKSLIKIYPSGRVQVNSVAGCSS